MHKSVPLCLIKRDQLLKSLSRCSQTFFRLHYRTFNCWMLFTKRLDLWLVNIIVDITVLILHEFESVFIYKLFRASFWPIFDHPLQFAGNCKAIQATISLLHHLGKVYHITNMFYTWFELLPPLIELQSTIHEILGVNQWFLHHIVSLVGKQNVFVLFLQWLVHVDVVEGEHCELFDPNKLKLKWKV